MTDYFLPGEVVIIEVELVWAEQVCGNHKFSTLGVGFRLPVLRRTDGDAVGCVSLGLGRELPKTYSWKSCC